MTQCAAESSSRGAFQQTHIHSNLNIRRSLAAEAQWQCSHRHIRIDLGGFPKNILTLISPGDAMSPANWFLPLFLPVNVDLACLMVEMKVLFLSHAFGKINPGWKKDISQSLPPVTKVCVCVLSAKY